VQFVLCWAVLYLFFLVNIKLPFVPVYLRFYSGDDPECYGWGWFHASVHLETGQEEDRLESAVMFGGKFNHVTAAIGQNNPADFVEIGNGEKVYGRLQIANNKVIDSVSAKVMASRLLKQREHAAIDAKTDAQLIPKPKKALKAA
jgi:hypothetical protein